MFLSFLISFVYTVPFPLLLLPSPTFSYLSLFLIICLPFLSLICRVIPHIFCHPSIFTFPSPICRPLLYVFPFLLHFSPILFLSPFSPLFLSLFSICFCFVHLFVLISPLFLLFPVFLLSPLFLFFFFHPFSVYLFFSSSFEDYYINIWESSI